MDNNASDGNDFAPPVKVRRNKNHTAKVGKGKKVDHEKGKRKGQ